MPEGGGPHGWEDKGGQVKVTLLSKKKKKRKGSTLDCCICSLWRLTKCSVCRIAGLETWMMRERGGVGWGGQSPGRSQGGLPGAVPPQSRAPRPCSPAPASPFLRGLPPGRARGQSSGPRPRSTARAAAVARRAETTKDGPWVTPARGGGRGPHTRKRQSTAGEPGAPRREAGAGAPRRLGLAAET